jgi:photosystem II stability/assembly factor-like uncharacterized protein
MVLAILASCEDTMSILTRPRPPRSDIPTDPEALEALIEEARRRARRRRRGYAAAALVAAAVGLLGFYGFNHGGGATRPQAGAELPQGEVGVGSQVGYGKWVSAPGPYDGISELVFDPQHPSTVFAATGGGVYRSADGGRTWRALELAPDADRVDALAIAPGDPKTLYAGTGRGVFKTTDGGASWQATSSDLLGNETAERRDHRIDEGYVYALAIDPRDPDTVYAGTSEAGAFKTTDGGASWRRIGLGAVGPLVLDPEDPETIYAGAAGAHARPPSGVFKSSDGGASWQPVRLQGTYVVSLTFDPQDPETIYAGAAGAYGRGPSGVFKSADGGATWRPAGLAGKNVGGRLLLDPQDPQTVYAEAWENDVNGVFKSSDGGRTWQALTIGREAELLALDPRNSTWLYADSNIGILTSSDAGRSWRATGWGPSNGSVSTLAVAPGHPGTAYAGVDHGGVFKRGSDVRWRATNTGLTDKGVHAVAVDPQEPANIYAVTDGGLFKSTTGGASWRHLPVPTTDNSTVAIDPQDPSTVYAITNDDDDDRSDLETRVFRSDDGGATWRLGGDVEKVPTRGAPDYGFPTFPLAIDPLGPDTLYAGGLRVSKSTDGGTTWRSVGLARTPVGALAIDPKEPAIVYAGTDAGLFKSTDAGASWRALHGPLDDVRVEALAIDPRQRQTVYAGTDRGVFWTTDGGQSWRRFIRLPVRTFDALAVDPAAGIVYAGAYGGGIFELSQSG